MGHNSATLARRIYNTKKAKCVQRRNQPTVQATQEVLSNVLDTLALRLTKRFVWKKREGDKCFPANLDCQKKTMVYEDRVYAFKFLMNLATYIMERKQRLPQIYLFGHPGAGKSTFVKMICDTLLVGRTFTM